MGIEKIQNLEECKEYVQAKLKELRPLFAKAAIGDFSEDVPMPEEDDEFTEFYTGIQTVIEVVRTKIADLESEVGQRQEAEQRLIDRNKELADSRKAIINVLEDIQFEKSIVQEEKEKLSVLLENLPIGVSLVKAPNGEVITINKRGSELIGRSIEQGGPNEYAEAYQLTEADGASYPLEKNPVAITLSKGIPARCNDMWVTRPDRSKILLRVSSVPIKISGGGLVFVIAIFDDITKEYELDRAKSEFISIASHQLRTPVTALKWLNEISSPAVKKLSPKEKEYFKNLSSSIGRLSKLVEDLLNVSRIELGTIKEERITLDLVSFVGDFIRDLKSYADSKDHVLIMNGNVKTALINIDSKMLYNILQNLTSNAIDYSPAKTSVTIDIDMDGGNVKVSISNKGPAIPADEQKKLFQKFYRGESTKKIKTEGTGLGLYIVKANVESVGGKVGFKSKTGEDTVFWFTLPVAGPAQK